MLAETPMTVKLQRCGAVDNRTVVSTTIHDFLKSIVPVRLFLTLDALWLSNVYLLLRSSRLHGKGTSCAYAIKTFMDIMWNEYTDYCDADLKTRRVKQLHLLESGISKIHIRPYTNI